MPPTAEAIVPLPEGLDKPESKSFSKLSLVLPTRNGLWVENVQCPPALTSPISSKSLCLAGAGVRGIQINPDLFVKVTCLGFYIDNELLGYVSEKWLEKELNSEDKELFADIISAPYEKLMKVTMLKPLPGSEFSKKVMENTKEILVKAGEFGPNEEKAVDRFQELCKNEVFLPGKGPAFLFSQNGVAIGFGTDSKDFSEVFGTEAFGKAILSSMIGEQGVSPATKASIAENIKTALAAAKAC